MEGTVGTSVQRIEDEELLRGDAGFIADISPFPESAAVVFVRSTHAHADLTSIDVAAAQQRPGVILVASSSDLAANAPGPHSPMFDAVYAQPLLATGRVRYVGEPVVAIVAETRTQAVDAAEWVEIEYEELPVVIDPRRACTDQVLLFDHRADGAPPTNVVASVPAPTEAPKESTTGLTVSVEVDSPRQQPAPIEARGVICDWIDGDLWVHASTQTPHSFRNKLAEIYALPVERVHVKVPWVGGGFGGKTTRSAEERVLPELSRLCSRPVQWIEDRSSYMIGATGGRGEYLSLELQGTDSGELRSLRVHLVKDAGAYPGVGAVLPEAYSKPIASGPYRIPDVAFSTDVAVTNTPPVGAFRGAGRAPIIAALERAVDLFAAQVGLDPALVRQKNLLTAHELPYDTPTGGRYDRADYLADFETLIDAADYRALRAAQRERRSHGDRLQLGLGFGCYLHNTSGADGEEVAVTVHSDGSATVVTGSTSQGHGHATVWAQVAGAALGIAPEQIRVIEGDTDLIATGNGAVGSRSVQTAAPAIQSAAETLVARAESIAARLLEANPGDVVLHTGRGEFHVAGVPSVAVGWAAVVAAAEPSELDEDSGEFECGSFFAPDSGVVPSGSHLAVIEVDVETGAARVDRFVAVDDAGVRVNPMLVEGQLHGGIAAGIGHCLGEAMVWDDAGNPLTSTFIDYPIITIDMVPQIELVAAEVPTELNRFGVKAVGESGPIGATAAIHNAVVDAVSHLGVEHIDLPLTPERVWRAVQDAVREQGTGPHGLNCPDGSH